MQPGAVNKICHKHLICSLQAVGFGRRARVSSQISPKSLNWQDVQRFRKSLEPTPLTGKSATSGEFHGAFEYYNCIWAANSPLVLREGYLNGFAPEGVVMLGAKPSSHRRTH